MGINFFNLSALGGKNYGEVWKPKAQRLMVGRDLAPITASEQEATKGRSVTVAQGDDVAFTATKLYSFVKGQAQSGLRVGNFRSQESLSANTAHQLEEAANSGLNGLVVGSKGDIVISLHRHDESSTLSAHEKYKDENGEEQLRLLESVRFKGDARVSWSEDGRPTILTDGAALNGGVLKAEGKDEILIRNSAVNVKAGENTTVYNFSSVGGEFSGGSSVTYLGSYQNSTFKDSSGANTYAGYFAESEILGNGSSLGIFSGVFEKSKIEAGQNDDTFSGYFSASAINGGNGKNKFSGMFLDGSEVTGGDDNDTFNGRFIASNLGGGKGDDSFGNKINLNTYVRVQTKDGKSYTALATDFVDSSIDAGEGDDKLEGVAWKSKFNMGEGDDSVKGVFSMSSIDGGTGNDKLSAMYSANSIFETGTGDDTVTLAAALANMVRSDEGHAKITLGGKRDEADLAAAADLGGDHLLPNTSWLTPIQAEKNLPGLAHGELRANFVNASKGENEVEIKNGQSSHKVMTGDILEGEEPKDAKAARSKEKARKAQNAAARENAELTGQAGMAGLAEKADNEKALMEESLAPQAEVQKRKLIGRYVMQSGGTQLQEGGLAAVVKTGAGENLIFHGSEFAKTNGARPVAHLLQSRASDVYAWTSKLS